MFSKMLLSADKLGGTFSLRYQGEERYRTYFGGFLTLMSIMIFMTFFFLTGIDFYMRINPHVTMSKTLSNDYFNYTINKTNFLFAFRIEFDGKLMIRPDLFYIEPHYIVFNQTETGMIKIIDEIVPFHRCDYSDSNYNNVYNSSVMSQFLCLDKPKDSEGYMTGGLYDAKFIKYFKIKISHCSAGEKYNKINNITCKSNLTEFNNLFNRILYVKYIIQSYYVDSDDYNNPFKLSFDSMYQTMEKNLQKKVYFYFKKGVLNDNKGWILDEENLKEFIGLDRQRIDFKDGNNDYSQNTFYEINLYFDRIIENFNRRYQKIQDVLAGVGGLIKIITFLFGNFIYYYNDHYRYVDLINSILIKNNGKSDHSSRSKFDYTMNKINQKLNNNNSSNYQGNSFTELNKNVIFPNSNNEINSNNINNVPIIQTNNNEIKETVLNNQKTLNPETKFKKIRSISVFKKLDEKTINAQSIHMKSQIMNNHSEIIIPKNVDYIKLSFFSFLAHYSFRRCKKSNQNLLNYLKFSEIADRNLDISKILEFFTKYEPIIDQIAMNCDLNYSSNMLLNQ